MSWKRLIIIILYLSIIGIYSCEKSKPECYVPVNILTRNEFVVKQAIHYDSTRTEDSISIQVDTTVISYRDTGFKAPTMKSIDMPQNLIIYGGANASVIGVPLEPQRQSLSYVIQYDTAVASFDTITYYYKTNNYFISNACGFTNSFYIDSIHITKNTLDSFGLIKPNIVTGNDRQVLLYFF